MLDDPERSFDLRAPVDPHFYPFSRQKILPGLSLEQIHFLIGFENPDERLLVFDRSEAKRFVLAPAAVIDDVVLVVFGPCVPAVIIAFLPRDLAVQADQLVVGIEFVVIEAVSRRVLPPHAIFDEIPYAMLLQVPVV